MANSFVISDLVSTMLWRHTVVYKRLSEIWQLNSVLASRGIQLCWSVMKSSLLFSICFFMVIVGRICCSWFVCLTVTHLPFPFPFLALPPPSPPPPWIGHFVLRKLIARKFSRLRGNELFRQILVDDPEDFPIPLIRALWMLLVPRVLRTSLSNTVSQLFVRHKITSWNLVTYPRWQPLTHDEPTFEKFWHE